MTEREAVEKLKAYAKCQLLQVKGIYEDCNEKKCDNCDLCYMQGTTGEDDLVSTVEVIGNIFDNPKLLESEV